MTPPDSALRERAAQIVTKLFCSCLVSMDRKRGIEWITAALAAVQRETWQQAAEVAVEHAGKFGAWEIIEVHCLARADALLPPAETSR